MLKSRSFLLTSKHHQLLHERAVELTRELKQPISCRHILDALLNLAIETDNENLIPAVLRRLNEPGRRR